MVKRLLQIHKALTGKPDHTLTGFHLLNKRNQKVKKKTLPAYKQQMKHNSESQMSQVIIFLLSIKILEPKRVREISVATRFRKDS